jgi:hypothetical protein
VGSGQKRWRWRRVITPSRIRSAPTSATAHSQWLTHPGDYKPYDRKKYLHHNIHLLPMIMSAADVPHFMLNNGTRVPAVGLGYVIAGPRCTARAF